MRLPGQAVGPGIDPMPLDDRISQFLDARLSQLLYVIGQPQDNWQAHACQHWGAPEDGVLAGRGLFDLQVRGTRVVSPGDRRRQRASTQKSKYGEDAG